MNVGLNKAYRNCIVSSQNPTRLTRRMPADKLIVYQDIPLIKSRLSESVLVWSSDKMLYEWLNMGRYGLRSEDGESRPPFDFALLSLYKHTGIAPIVTTECHLGTCIQSDRTQWHCHQSSQPMQLIKMIEGPRGDKWEDGLFTINAQSGNVFGFLQF